MMLSRLARHTRNLDERSDVSLLLEDLVPGDPMANGRVSLSGSLVPVEDSDARRRFLSRQPGARFYADLGDFALYRLEISRGHLVAGFGRIADILPAALVRAGPVEVDIAAREADIAEHMNADHRDAVADYARGLLAEEAGEWRFDGLDPLGCEIALQHRARYLHFDRPLSGAGDARIALVELAKRARAGIGARENAVGP
jgi:putative heme iron utilization protein